MRIMTIIVLLTKLVILFILPKTTESYEQISISNEHIPLIIDICKLYRTSSVIFLYDKSIREMEIATMMFKWTRALSNEGLMTTNFYYSELHKSSYYIKKIVRPLYVAMISNNNAIDEFSLATSTFDMSFAVWLVIFTYSGRDPDYCHNPPFNIFHLRFDSKMIVRCGRENILHEWYSIDKNQTEIDDVALWNLEKGITTIAPNNLYDRRTNLKGMIMKVVIIKNSSLIKVMKNGKLDGIFGRTFEELSVSLNFTFHVVSEIEEYGAWDPKQNKWTGAIGEISSRNADICPSSFTMSNSRLDAVDFTLPFYVSETSFYIQEPQKFSFKWSSFFMMFSYSIWISILGIIIVACILLTFLKMNIRKNQKIEFSLSDNFLEIWGIFCQQGLADFPNNCTLRIVYFSIFILVIILWTAYSAAVISFLTTAKKILPFHSLEDFANDSSYQLYVFRESIFYDRLLNSKAPYADKIRKLMIRKEKLSTNALIGLNTVCEHQNIALYTSEAVKENIKVKLPCDIISIKIGEIDLTGMVLSKNNPYTDVINFQLQKFVDSGRMHHLKQKSLGMTYADNIKYKPVHLTSVISLIFFILIGIVLSICILIIEVCVFGRKKKKKLVLQAVSSINLQRCDIKSEK